MQLYIWLQESMYTHHSGVLEWIWIISCMTPDHLTSSLQVLALKGWLKWFFSNLNISSSLRTYRAAQQGVCEASRSFNLSERRGPLESADQSLISLPLQFFQIDSWARKEGQRRIRRDTSFIPQERMRTIVHVYPEIFIYRHSWSREICIHIAVKCLVNF